MPRSKAAEILNRHADAGRALLAEAETIGDHTAWKDWSEKFDRWRHVTENALHAASDQPELWASHSRQPRDRLQQVQGGKCAPRLH